MPQKVTPKKRINVKNVMSKKRGTQFFNNFVV